MSQSDPRVAHKQNNNSSPGILLILDNYKHWKNNIHYKDIYFHPPKYSSNGPNMRMGLLRA